MPGTPRGAPVTTASGKYKDIVSIRVAGGKTKKYITTFTFTFPESKCRNHKPKIKQAFIDKISTSPQLVPDILGGLENFNRIFNEQGKDGIHKYIYDRLEVICGSIIIKLKTDTPLSELTTIPTIKSLLKENPIVINNIKAILKNITNSIPKISHESMFSTYKYVDDEPDKSYKNLISQRKSGITFRTKLLDDLEDLSDTGCIPENIIEYNRLNTQKTFKNL